MSNQNPTPDELQAAEEALLKILEADPDPDPRIQAVLAVAKARRAKRTDERNR